MTLLISIPAMLTRISRLSARVWTAGVTPRRFLASLMIGVTSATLCGCSALDVSNPTRVTMENVENSVGANYTLSGVQRVFGIALGRSVMSGGLLADEFFVADRNVADVTSEWGALDRRESAAYEKLTATGDVALYGRWQTTWRYATIALPFVRQYGQASNKNAQLSELFAIRGYVMLGLAEQICPGFPVRDVDVRDLNAIRPVYTSAPQTTDSAFRRAVTQFDSALAYAGDSVRLRDLARVGKARALLGLGQFAEAGTVAATVSTGYIWMTVPPIPTIYYLLRYFSVAASNSEGVNGLDFVAAADSRAAVQPVLDGEGNTLWYSPTYYYNTFYPSVTVASDIEARLILAESQLQPAAAPSGPWLETLNALRQTIGLADLSDPVTASARVDLLFRERAFWLFATGHRLGDLRRLISRYGRDAETVFPTGSYVWPGNYGTATSIPFNGAFEHTYNAAITGCQAR